MIMTPEEPTLEQVSDGVVVRQAIDNMGWADMGGYTLIIDALEEPDLKEEVFRAVEETMPPQSVKVVLNTHVHYDHMALNAAFQDEFGADIVNRDTEDIAPDGKTFKGTGRTCTMIPMPQCHTGTDCLVWFPRDSVLFVGDLFGWGLIPSEATMRPEAQVRVTQIYKRLIRFNAKTVVPGHGPLCSTAELKRWLDYFNDLRKQIKGLVDQGVRGDELYERVPPPKDMQDWWRFVSWKHGDSVDKMRHAAENGWL